MRGPVVVVTRPGEGLGFRLAGVTTWEVPVGEEVARLGTLAEGKGPALVLIDDEIHRALPETLVARIERRGLPVLFPIALPRTPAGGRSAEDYVGTLVRRAIGFHVRLER